jgi:hypothetical protein
LPVLKKVGRHKASVTEEVIIEAYGQFKSCASYLENIIKQKYGLKINHMKINYVLKQEGLAMNEPKKWHRKKWIRYERECSNSL